VPDEATQRIDCDREAAFLLSALRWEETSETPTDLDYSDCETVSFEENSSSVSALPRKELPKIREMKVQTMNLS
jgi:hypothetical protein